MKFDRRGTHLSNGDCLDLMKRIPDGSVDMVLCDLPYGTTQNKWDTPLPLDRLWAEYKRVCKGAMVFTAAQPFTSALVMSNVREFKYDWTWRKIGKATGHLNAKKQPMRDKEDVLVFWHGKQGSYNPQMGQGAPFKNKAGKDHAAATSMSGSYGTYTNFRNDNDGARYPRQVLEMHRVERDTLHPTQKPVALMEYLIRTYTNSGDTVLDNCMGSGTTGVACVQTGRKFIGMELDPTYFAAAKARIENTRLQTGEPGA